MRIFQLIVAVLTLFMASGMFGFNTWINAQFSKGLAIPQCYMPMNVITTVLVFILAITVFIRK